LRYLARNILRRPGRNSCRLFLPSLLKYPGALLLTDLESGHKANNNSGFPAGFVLRSGAAPQISAFLSPTKNISTYQDLLPVKCEQAGGLP